MKIFEQSIQTPCGRWQCLEEAVGQGAVVENG